MGKVVEIVYVATNGYCEYAKKFFDSLKYFMPGEKKIVTVLSNKMEEYNNYAEGDVISTRVIHMFDLIYPCINLHKSYFLEQLPHVNVDYIFYFDADTIFKNVPDYNWDKMKSDLDLGKVLISKHPMYAAKDDFKLYGVPKQDWISNFYTANMTEKNIGRQAYIEYDEYTYVISSFFAANVKTMHTLNEKIIRMTRNDLTRDTIYHIPQYMDENYFNALTSDYENGIFNGILFSVEQYSELYNGKSNDYDTVFIYQKNFPNHKTNRR